MTLKRAASRIARQALSAPNFGRFRYRWNPANGRSWGGPMNGQKWRCLMVAEIIAKFQPQAIVETGTYLGQTTEWLAAFQTPIYSCEYSEENFGFAKERLKNFDNIQLKHGDSRDSLKAFLEGSLVELRHSPLLFYLDAHWGEDLPLAEEVDQIFSNCSNALVLIDDFQVADDERYGFDDYGKGKALTLDYLGDTIRKFDLTVQLPSTPSKDETGAKRGCALLSSMENEQVVRSISLLRPVSFNFL